MQYFATQLSTHQQQRTANTLRADQYLKKKRNKDSDDDQSSQSRSRPVAGVQSDVVDHFEIPPPSPKEAVDAFNVQQEIAKPPLRLYDVHATSAVRKGEFLSVKRRHLDVLSALMHRCLLQGDYARAGRAWGMLLRSSIGGGHYIDPRNHERWGIGAEILLHRRQTDSQSESEVHVRTLSEEGFELAREYYERLIVQHPNRRAHPNSVDDRSFYPAMFSLCIFEACEKSKVKRNKIRREARRSNSMSLNSVMEDESELEITGASEDAIQNEELSQAREIAARIDQLVSSPPFDKQADLLQLRGHVSLWMSALMVGETSDDEDWDMESYNEHLSGVDSQQLNHLRNCQRELLLAQDFFQRAKVNGAPRQLAMVASVELKMKQVARQVAKLNQS